MHKFIKVIQDDELPDGVDWALVECRDTGNEVFFVKESAACCPEGMAEAMAEGWAAYRKLDRHHTPCRQGGGGGGEVVFLPMTRAAV